MIAAHLERELKLTAPPAAQGALLRAFAPQRRGVRRIDLSASYFDTPARDLARAGMALRVRRENGRWVQTLKAGGADTSARAEYSVDRPDATLDLGALTGTPAAPVLARGAGCEALAMRYEVAVERLCVRRRVDGGVVELALDRGTIASPGHSEPVFELEVELLRGATESLFETARRLQARYGLVLDLRSKAERGDALAEGRDAGAPRAAATVGLAGGMSPDEALRRVAGECLAQVSRNVAALALGRGDARHVHETRIGLRRLRTAWRLFRGWGPEVPAGLVDGARTLFADLGPLRERDVLGEVIVPALLRAGMPPQTDVAEAGAEPAGTDPRAAEIASSARVQGWLIELLRWVETPGAAQAADVVAAVDGAAADPTAGTAPDAPALRRRLVRRLTGWLVAIVDPVTPFEAMDAAERHALRKRAKRLRYAIEFGSDLLPRRWRTTCLPALVDVQRALGALNDLASARVHFLARAETVPTAWFAVGWIAAREARSVRRASRALRRLRAASESLR